MVQIISTWLFQPNKHKLRKFLSTDRDRPSEGRIRVWIIQQSLILGLVLIECGDIIKKSLWGWQGRQWGMIQSGSEPRSSVAMETSSAVCVSEEISEERGLCKSTWDWKGLYKTQMCEAEQKPALQSLCFHQLWLVKEKASDSVTLRFAT